MESIGLFRDVADYTAHFHQHALPDREIAEHPFYERLIAWVLRERTPLLYHQDHPDEYTNLSINFNWLLLRDYRQTSLGPPDTIATMYVVHELAHMTHWLPTKFDELSAGEYADQFTRSEYRASNETEILLHYRVPDVRSRVFPDVRIAVDYMLERDIVQPSMSRLCNMRPLWVEDTVLDELFADEPELVANFKRFDQNRSWARERFIAIAPHFSGLNMPLSTGLTNDEYEPTLAGSVADLSQAQYEANMIRNVRFGFAMCGLEVPELTTIQDAVVAGAELEGSHAIVQS